MNRLSFYVALFVAKMSYLFLKLTKISSGTAIIGLLSLKICPNFLIYVNKYIKRAKINVTGTNGKTTTSGLVAHLFQKSNKKITYNNEGANMLNGIVNTLAVKTCPLRPVDYSIIETDEAFLSKIYDKMDSDYLLVTNLFEDQTDRFANPIFTRDLIQEAIDKKPDIQLFLNADEPVSASLVSKNKAPIYYGIKEVYDEDNNLIETPTQEFKCPSCGKLLNYTKSFYSQVGHYSCDCGYNRPVAKYNATVKLYKKYFEITLDNEVYEIPLVGLYNAYNALGAIVLAKELGLENIKENIKSFKVAFGRSEKRIIKGQDTIIQLIKNPAGTNEVLKTIDLDSNILIAANNNIADGTDISWINQVDFEKLAGVNKEIIVTGLCYKEVEERLKKAGVQNLKPIPEINKAIEYLSQTADNDITILTTYTALLKIDKIKEIKKCY